MSLPSSKRTRRRTKGTTDLVSITSVLGNVIEHLILEIIFRHMKGKKITNSRIHQREVMFHQPDKLL